MFSYLPLCDLRIFHHQITGRDNTRTCKQTNDLRMFHYHARNRDNTVIIDKLQSNYTIECLFDHVFYLLILIFCPFDWIGLSD